MKYSPALKESSEELNREYMLKSKGFKIRLFLYKVSAISDELDPEGISIRIGSLGWSLKWAAVINITNEKITPVEIILSLNT